MCRYGMYGPYKSHYACFDCRKSFKYFRDTPCPQCRRPLHHMGRDFQAPKQRQTEQWQVIEILFAHGIIFDSCGCSGPGYRPTRLRELPAFLAK